MGLGLTQGLGLRLLGGGLGFHGRFSRPEH